MSHYNYTPEKVLNLHVLVVFFYYTLICVIIVCLNNMAYILNYMTMHTLFELTVINLHNLFVFTSWEMVA